VQPVNKYWLAHTALGPGATRFFATGGAVGGDWSALRDRWELGHAVRAALAAIAFFALLLSMKL
jgi:hypothetical protein